MEFPEGTVGSGSSIAAAVAQVTDVTWVWYPWPGNFIMPQVWRCEVENVLWGWKCAVKLKILCAECGISDFSKPFLYLLLFFKRWSLVDLQCFNFCYTAECFGYTYIFFSYCFPLWFITILNIEYWIEFRILNRVPWAIQEDLVVYPPYI